MSRARDLADGTFSGAFSADSPTFVVDDTNNRVGVGEATPDSALHVNSGTTNEVAKFESTDTEVTLELTDSTGTSKIKSRADFRFETGATPTEAARIDSSGNFLVGKTAPATNVEGGELRENGQVLAVATNVNPFFAARLGSDGDMVVFRKDGTTVGSIGNSTTTLYITNAATTGLKLGANAFYATDGTGSNSDNTKDVGASTVRFDDVYATNGTIQTSDANEKQDVAELDEAEKRVATAAKGLIRKFRWISSVEEKGDDARIHVGVIAQDLKAAFEAEGLDPGRYAMFIRSTWWEADEVIPAVEAVDEVVDEDGNIITEAVEAQPERTETRTYETAEEAPEGAVERTRLGVRYNQLLAFIIGAI